MPKNSMLMPIVMLIAITIVIGFVMMTERTNAPTVTGDANYHHQICTFNRYCAGSACSDEPMSVIAYFAHADGEPRLEVPGMSTQATMERRNGRTIFSSTGGTLSGSLTIYDTRNMDFVATDDEFSPPQEHYASGRCDRPIVPRG